MNKIKLRVPHYYTTFTCIADKCRDNCCMGGWQIDIDEETASYYKRLKGEFGDRLRASLDYTDAYCFKLMDNKCPFLDKDNLCDIYKKIGPEHMGVVCSQFPRFTEYYGEYKEMGIGLACEEAARIILEDTEPFHYIEMETDEELYEDSEYDAALAVELFKVRDRIYELLEQPELSESQKYCYILSIADAVQKKINTGEYDGLQAVEAENLAETAFSEEFIKNIWYSYLEMELLKEDYGKRVDSLLEVMHKEESDNTFEYLELVRNFNRLYKEAYSSKYCNLIKYFIYRYALKAAYDHDFLGKIQLAISAVIIIRELDMFSYSLNKELTYKEHMNNVHIFSREIEYCSDNIEALHEEFVFGDTFDLKKLETVVRFLF